VVEEPDNVGETISSPYLIFALLLSKLRKLVNVPNMGNQHSAPDKERERVREKEKEKEKEREKEQSNVRSTLRHEKQRSRTIPATTPLPPTETKVNAEQTSYTPSDPQHNVKSSLKPQESSNNAESSSTSLNETPVKERRAAQTLPIKDATEAVQNLTLEELPARPTEDEIVRNAAETEPTPKFETMRVASQTSIVDEEELREPDGPILREKVAYNRYNAGAFSTRLE
jgi:hypothetical protein